MQGHQHHHRKHHQPGGQAVRSGKLRGLDMVEDGHRQHACAAGDVAADHQHHAKLAHGVRKAQHRGRHQPRPGERQRDAEKTVQRAGAQSRSGFQRALRNRLKSLLQRLHDKGHGVQHRSHHQATERERQPAKTQRLRELAHRPLRPHQQQQIEPQHRGRQYQGHGHRCRPQRLQRRAGARQPPRQRRAHDEQQRGRRCRQSGGQADGGPVIRRHRAAPGWP